MAVVAGEETQTTTRGTGRSGAARWFKRVQPLRHLGALLVGFVFLVPLLWTFVVSLARDADVYRFPPKLWPDWQWHNYSAAWHAAPWGRYFANTVFIAGSVVALVLATSLLAGFSFAVMKFRGRNVMFIIVMGVMMVPQTVLLIPNFILASKLGLYDTYAIQILPWGASVFGIFLLRQFFQTLPRELFEAAEMDGAGTFTMLFRVAAPLAVPSLVLVGLNAFMGSWNAFVWPFLMTKTDSIRPIEVGLQAFAGTDGTDWPLMCAAVTFTTIPVVFFFLILQKYFVQGLYRVEGAVRG